VTTLNLAPYMRRPRHAARRGQPAYRGYREFVGAQQSGRHARPRTPRRSALIQVLASATVAVVVVFTISAIQMGSALTGGGVL
jgi:hypothetical protein